MQDPRILLLVDSESQLSPARRVAAGITARLGGAVDVNLLPTRRGPSERQIELVLGEDQLRQQTLEELLETDVLSYDVVIAYLVGSKLYALGSGVRAKVAAGQPRARPVLVTGYNGVVYEKQVEGLLWRLGCDIIAVNSAADFEMFAAVLEQLGFTAESLVRTGLPQADGRGEAYTKLLAAARDELEVRSIMFACQAAVPTRREERAYLLAQLRDYALAHPDRQVIIKPRTLPDEATFQRERHHFEPLFDLLYPTRPPNLSFEYGSFQDCLARVDQVISVSSTAVMEAVAMGKLGAILTDLGIKESYGNHFFTGSGMLTTMPALIGGEVPKPDARWLEANGFASSDSLASVAAKVATLLAKQREADSPLPFQPMYYGADKTPFYVDDRVPELASRAAGPQPTVVERFARKLRKFLFSPRRFIRDARRKRALSAG